MKLYRGNYRHPHEGTLLAWGASKAQVTMKLRELAACNDDKITEDNSDIQKYDIAPTLHDFIRFLNTYVTTDNG